ncbi:MAG: YidH family protein, partial [Microvirga sp.]
MNPPTGKPPVTAQSDPDRISVELSSRRTGMSFQRTRMSADRTLMSVIRTSLSLIGFGFTIVQFFQKLRDADLMPGATAHATRNFGLTLVFLGVGMLALGIGFHLQFMRALRVVRAQMRAEGLIHGESPFPISLTVLVAVVLLVVGLVAIASIALRIG